ncbi:hypothetical protein WJX73_004102 [Symbiochloris irregularis]|uniref:GTP 3',8-cyclase n=1 Tax=Symbiochloris irregularis TaxID=706552 RepID=A0AAW1PYK0_9CHLO
MSHRRGTASAAQQEPSSRRQRPWPTVEEAAERLRSGKTASCSTPTQQPQTDTALHWKEALSAVARPAQGQELLTDTFGRRHTYLRISLTERCNLRCVYCMPAEGVELTPSQDVLTTDEIVNLAEIFVAAGVNKIRLTGGEPTLRRDIVPLTQRLHSLPGNPAIGITSNAIALRRSLAELQQSGLSLLNISLDTLQPQRFEQMTRRRGLQKVLDCIHHAVDLGFDPVKVNVVVMRGTNDDELLDFVAMTQHLPINVRFIEWMPFDGNVWKDSRMVPYREMLAAVQAHHPQLQRCQDPAGEVAKNFYVPGHRGTVSFVTSMTQAFCGDCNRLRLMADGNLKVCLFGANEVSLRDALRQGATTEELQAIVSAAVDRKKAAHAGMFELAQRKNRAMVKIGG